MTTSIDFGAARFAVALLLAGGCASVSYSRLEAPAGRTAFGLDFGASRAEVEGALRAREIPFAEPPGDPDALLAARCPQAPSSSACRLSFGPLGLYAAQVEAPPADAGRLVAVAEKALGAPTRRGAPDAEPTEGEPAVIAAWARDGWTVGVSQVAPPDAAPSAVLRVELDAVTPPVVAGVPLGRRRAHVEHLLDLQGAVLVQRDDDNTTYLGCPLGDGAAITCVISFREGLASAVTEVHPTPNEDDEALGAWRALSERLAGEIGRAPQASCPSAGPDRITGDCTSVWAAQRLVVVVGAHRNAGGKHRGGITVYTAWSYPPLAPGGGAAPEG